MSELVKPNLNEFVMRPDDDTVIAGTNDIPQEVNPALMQPATAAISKDALAKTLGKDVSELTQDDFARTLSLLMKAHSL